MKRLHRRSVLRALAGLTPGASALVRPFLLGEARAQADAPAPLRLLILQTPDGRPPETWLPTGTTTNFSLGPALRPFEAYKEDLVVLSGIEHRPEGSEPHCAGLSVWMTGVPGLVTRDNYTAAQAPSFDQLIAAQAPFANDTRFRSLQLAGDMTVNPIDISHRYLSWAGKDQPLPAEHRPIEIYKRLFASMTPAGTPDDEALTRLRRERRSVIDLLQKDWRRMATVVPAAQRPAFEGHLGAIRNLERELDRLDAPRCHAPSSVPDSTDGPDFPAVIDANLEMVRLALACDLSRVITFMSSPTTSHLIHQRWIPEITSSDHHHRLSHLGDVDNLARIGLWYSTHLARFIGNLKATSTGARSLLDDMLVVYASELGYGFGHQPRNVPWLLFGRAGGRLETGRWLERPGRSSNDVWVSVAQALGLPWTTFGDPLRCDGALPGLL